MTTKQPQETDFTRDVLGRYICNGMDEALASTNPNGQRPNGIRKTTPDHSTSS